MILSLGQGIPCNCVKGCPAASIAASVLSLDTVAAPDAVRMGRRVYGMADGGVKGDRLYEKATYL